jgi:hypothetical protein
MKTNDAKFIVFSVLLKSTDLLAPSAITNVISKVMPKAIKSGGRPEIFNFEISFFVSLAELNVDYQILCQT